MPERGHRRSTALIEVSPELGERLRDPRLVLALVAGAAGAVALFVGYLGVSGTLDPGKQLPYLISGGVGGLFLLGVAAALLFSADLAALRTDIADLRRLVEDIATRDDDTATRDGHTADAPSANGASATAAPRTTRAPRQPASR
jgi:hypothetical protein